MTQPYVPPSGDDKPTGSNPGWPPAQAVPASEPDAELFASQFPDPASSGTGYSEPTSNVYTADTAYVGRDVYSDSPASTSDVAKDQAAEVKDTAVAKGQQVADVAKDQAAVVKDTAVEQGQQVAGVAKEQVSKVASEATHQIKTLLGEGRSELSSQAVTQQQRLATGLHSLAGELGSMASKSEQSGPLTDLAHQASAKGGEIAHWLENHEPADLLYEVKAFARRRPVAFLGLAALAGVVAGRLTRGIAAEAKNDSTPSLAVSAPSAQLTAAPQRENMSLQEIPTSGTGAGPTTDRPDLDWTADQTAPLGTTSSFGTSDSFGTPGRDDVIR